MVRKPEIQYVGQFYVHGSEAQQLEPKQEKRKAKTKLPLVRLENIQKLYVDPVALCGMAVAVFMLVTMVIGAVHIQDSWQDYAVMSNYLSDLKRENAELSNTYHSGYDLAAIESQALALGMIPASEAETISITITPPAPKEEPNRFQEAWEDFVWFIDGLFA